MEDTTNEEDGTPWQSTRDLLRTLLHEVQGVKRTQEQHQTW